MQTLIENFFTCNNLRSDDEESLVKLVQELDYSDLSSFFADNSGAIEAVINWIGKQRCDEWKEALTVRLRGDIQELLDEGYIELEDGETNRYILTSTMNIVFVADRQGARHLVGSIDVDGDTVTFFDESDNQITDIGEYSEAYGFKLTN